jgi:hypothetical protein
LSNEIATDDTSPTPELTMPEMTMEEILAGKSKQVLDTPQEDPQLIPPGNDYAELSPDILTNPTGNAHKIDLDEDVRLKKELNTANPLIPPLKGENDKRPKPRLLGTATWLLLACLVGCGVIFLKFRPQIMSSIEEIGRVLGGG